MNEKLQRWQIGNSINVWHIHAVGGSWKDPGIGKLSKLKHSTKRATLTFDLSSHYLLQWTNFVIYSFIASAADRYLWQCP